MDAISNDLLRHLPEKWILVLHEFFKKCGLQGIIPKMWKHSILIPIAKQGKSTTIKDNYRPIALTSHTGKLMEKIF